MKSVQWYVGDYLSTVKIIGLSALILRASLSSSSYPTPVSHSRTQTEIRSFGQVERLSNSMEGEQFGEPEKMPWI